MARRDSELRIRMKRNVSELVGEYAIRAQRRSEETFESQEDRLQARRVCDA